VAGLGVQVLFGFLLAMPFSQGFSKLDDGQRQLYLACLLLAALSTALLMGPVAYHRLVFRQRQKEHLVQAANLMAISGLVAVGLAISASVLLVVGVVETGPVIVVIPVVVVCLFAVLWFAIPLTRRWRAETAARRERP
jgi:putative flippase GtrA